MYQIKYEDYIAITAIVFEWADSYDNKDWDRLREVLAPTMMIDYTIVGHDCFPDMPADEFVGMMSSPKFLGDPLVRTQHLMGAAKYEQLSETEIIGHHQIRAAHQRYTSNHRLVVEERGHGHSYVKHWYKKIDGCWKLAGVCPRVYWNEHNFDKIFPHLSAAH
ncbi:conidial pigment biosynthesis scytalone dehydratase Arp1 [Paecilomyces variotii No. 5]|uniref:Conidial pigment biosynthesis scytalone dehydratase Arp1 n=1 Tax=Byssochlamys spectabilis (strain No. 5 / NBRC 109023) TaxID=1356009 RepID=V5I5S5_BYSSN|nr:conidial pigment biosynthesis scytalone dehydratase Arp1 [Paecilomyces variotii No. 5]